MINIKAIYFFTLLTIALIACNNDKDARTKLGRVYAQQQLKLALTDKAQHNVIASEEAILKDSLTAISVVEPILFEIYGKDNITKQRPYEIYLIDKYWVIGGTLPKEYDGGTFLIIIDSRDSKVIKVAHGK